MASTVEVVPLDRVLFHEDHDVARVAPLAQAIARDGAQRNPVIVARTRNGRLIHLDGANRIVALARLGCRHVAAQLVDYHDPHAVSLHTWLHLTRLSEHRLREAAHSWRGCELGELPAEAAAEALTTGGAAAMLVFRSGATFALRSGPSPRERCRAMRRLTELYAQFTVREALPCGTDLAVIPHVLARTPQAGVCVAFAPLTKDAIVTFASATGALLPAGISRHVIDCGRELNVNAPLALLQADLPVAEKTSRLRDLLAQRQARRYAEPTIVYEP